MKIETLMRQLKNGELAGTAYADDPSKNSEKMVDLINISLNEFATKYKLKESNLLIQTINGITRYPISLEHAMSQDTTSSLKFILDSKDDPYPDDFLYAVSASCGIEKVWINMQQYWSIFTPSPDVLIIPSIPSLQNPIYDIVYVAKFPEITELSGNINIPNAMANAFRYYVAYSYYNSLSGQDTSNKVQLMLQKYDSEIQTLNNLGLLTPQLDSGFHAIDGGFL